MKKLKSNEIRNMWIDFFEKNDHLLIPSASLVPKNDKSLLWINSGVATLKSYFDGSEKPPSKRMTNVQKVLRTTDIENVGETNRHHTFFEMVGNFSIGDYFKKEAITMAWELLTSKKYFNIDPSLLYITVFKDDSEALKIWESLGIKRDRIFLMGRDTNFWDMGKGPCGPSTEIFFDRGKKYHSKNASELIKKDIENDRFVEIWNIVFSEFNNDGENNFKQLPQKNIDTGAGLERLTAIFQDKPSSFETDLFADLIKKIDSKTKDFNYEWDYIPTELKSKNLKQFKTNKLYKAIADYIRAVSFAIGDGAEPGPKERGYILRNLIRKAVLYKNDLGIKENFLHELVEPLVKVMGTHYPELKKNKKTIIHIIQEEEKKFNKTLTSSLERLNELVKNKQLNEESSFKLHETYGLPLDILKDIAKDYKLDWNKINKLDKEFKNMSKQNAKKIDAMNIQDDVFIGLEATKFIGREKNKTTSKVIFVKGDKVVFDETPFYATAGGQESDFGKANNFDVTYVTKTKNQSFVHEIKGNDFKVGDKVKLSIDTDRRKNMRMHHSGAHLLFRALEIEVGKSILQSGSKVEDSYLRFDFPSTVKLTETNLENAEKICNDWIKKGTKVETIVTTFEEAKKLATSRVEGFDYGNEVRVVKINDEVVDLCTGTHVSNSKEIEKLTISKYEKIGSGTFRLEAVVGKKNIENWFIEKNQKYRKDILDPAIRKVELLNKKIEELKIGSNINFNSMIKKVDETKGNFKSEILKITETINRESNKQSKEIETKLIEQFKISLNENKLLLKEFKTLNIQEATKILLSIIDGYPKALSVIKIENNDKVTVGFVLNKDLVNDEFIKRIKTTAEKHSLRGNGSRQLYIFGGTKIDFDSLKKEVTEWEF